MRHITLHNTALFFRQLATLIDAGMPLLESLTIIEHNFARHAYSHLITNIKQQILTGKTLFTSINTHAQYFNPLILQLIYIGERSGKLTWTLNLIADDLEKSIALHERIYKALFYPCLICIVAALITIFMLIFIVPKFADLLAAFSTKPPLLTQGIFYCAQWLNHCRWLFLLLLLSIIACSLHAPYRQQAKQYLTQLIIHLPYCRDLYQRKQLAHFSQQLACLYSAGIPLNEGLSLLIQVNTHPLFTRTLTELQYKINRGWPLPTAIANLTFFPPLMIQMVRIGAESGKLDLMLNKIANIYNAEIDRWLHRSTQLLEPLIMLVLGVLIGGLVIGMYLPIFKLGSAF